MENVGMVLGVAQEGVLINDEMVGSVIENMKTGCDFAKRMLDAVVTVEILKDLMEEQFPELVDKIEERRESETKRQPYKGIYALIEDACSGFEDEELFAKVKDRLEEDGYSFNENVNIGKDDEHGAEDIAGSEK